MYERRPPPPQISTGAKPVYGRPVQDWDPVELGVHPVIGGGQLPVYVCRPHDELLRTMLDPAVPASRLVVVRGGSSTGKTRAAYEAVSAQLADWQLDYPLDPGGLAARLEAGIPARSVLWLGELRQYADAEDGRAVLGRLADLLNGKGQLVITTMWPEQWAAYTAAARARPGNADPFGTAGQLLERLPELTGRDPARINPARGGVMDIPDHFTPAELEAAAHTGDAVLTAAVAAAASAGQNGQVTQFLAGVPDLLRRHAGPGGDPYGQAIITAAMDATRLGHARQLPAPLLQDAAVGYLSDAQRTAEMTSWRDTALVWATAELHGAVRALQPVPPATGTGVVGYQIADYLDQQARRTRQDQLGPSSLWDAFTAHATSADDLNRLGRAARDRGLYRHAAALWTTAVALGNTDAASWLIGHLRRVNPGDTIRAAGWVAARASLGDPGQVASLLEALREAGTAEAIRALLARDPAGTASLNSSWDVVSLVRTLREAGAHDAAHALAMRAAGQASLGDAGDVAMLLQQLHMIGADNAVGTLLAREPAGQVPLSDAGDVGSLLQELCRAGADDQVRTLLARDPARHASLGNTGDVAWLLRQLRMARADDQVRSLLARDPARHASLDHPDYVAEMLLELSEVNANEAANTLTTRITDLYDPGDIAWVLEMLREAGASDAVRVLAIEAAGRASLGDPGEVASLLMELRAANDDKALAALLARDPGGQASLSDPGRVARLLKALHEAGDGPAVRTLLARDPVRDASLDNSWRVILLLQALDEAGASDAVRVLAIEAAGRASLGDPGEVASLLMELRAANDDKALAALLARDPAGQASLSDPGRVARLLKALHEVGGGPAVTALLARDPAGQVGLDEPAGVSSLLLELRAAGGDDAADALTVRAANAGMFKVFPDEISRYPFGRQCMSHVEQGSEISSGKTFEHAIGCPDSRGRRPRHRPQPRAAPTAVS